MEDLNSCLGGNWTYLDQKTASGSEAGDDVLEVNDVKLLNTNTKGSIRLTKLQLVFTSDGLSVRLGSFALTAIERVYKLQAGRNGLPSMPSDKLLQVQGKDLRTAVFAFPPSTRKRSEVQDAVLRALPRALQDLHAWACPSAPLPAVNCGEELVVCEYRRLLALQPTAAANWRISDVNANYGVCATYPSRLMLPSGFSNDEVYAAAAFRARGRLPVFCWQHPDTGAVLSRSGQPMVGFVLNSRSDADEKLVAALTGVSKRGQPARKLIIADARPRKNALANGALGGGSEPSSHYRSSEVVYLGIDNIHAMKDSGARLRDYLDQHGAACSDGSSSLLRCGGASWAGGWASTSGAAVAGAAQALCDTGWLVHLHTLLSGAVFVAAHIALRGNSVLVHCSDGWDRTPALLCTALLMLDPYYRTFAGFQALVELHWAAFGHQFADRMGVPSCSGLPNLGGSSSLSSHEVMSTGTASSSASYAGFGMHSSYAPGLSRSSVGLVSAGPNPANGVAANPLLNSSTAPILLQWVDCVCQLLRLFPREFEFTTAFLVDFLDNVLACRFGNFLGNSEKERQQSGVWKRCSSIWDYLEGERRAGGSYHPHCNIFYSETKQALLPPAAALSPVLIPELYLRWSCPPPLSSKMMEGGVLPKWWEDATLSQREIHRQTSSLLSAQQALTATERRATSLEEEVDSLRRELESEKREKEELKRQAAEKESEKDNLLKALRALGATCHMQPARQMNAQGSSCFYSQGSGSSPQSCTHLQTSSAYAPLQSDSLGFPACPVADPLAVSLSLPLEDDICLSNVCNTCSKPSSSVQNEGRKKRVWVPGACKRGSSSLVGLQADFEALEVLSQSFRESHFASTQPHIQHTVGT